ncbi:hypothetical protein, partial [Marinobacter sp. 1-3A]|uniref:hypothetical protein n=1 Tax=Marinobacter sp. 1-3A TaxID=2582920 RepID=UPI001D129117
SEVKQACADGSVAFAHVRVGHRQTLKSKPQLLAKLGFFYARIMTARTVAVRTYRYSTLRKLTNKKTMSVLKVHSLLHRRNALSLTARVQRNYYE